jgi:hypothetical protein
MTAPMEGYDEVDAIESFDDFESAGEATFPFRPGGRVFVAGGLSTATLHTPKGPAKLNLPSPVPTLTQFRTLEQALNANTQRVNAVQTELGRVRRELALRRRDPQGQSTMSLLFTLLGQRKLRADLEGHTHKENNTPPILPAASGDKFSSILPLLLLQPGMFGQSGAGSSSSSTQDAMSPLLMMVLLDVL